MLCIVCTSHINNMIICLYTVLIIEVVYAIFTNNCLPIVLRLVRKTQKVKASSASSPPTTTGAVPLTHLLTHLPTSYATTIGGECVCMRLYICRNSFFLGAGSCCSHATCTSYVSKKNRNRVMMIRLITTITNPRI